MTFDVSTLPAAVRDRLARENVVWLTTVKPSGQPVPTPVWFAWVDGQAWIRSRPSGAKLAHLRDNPYVALNLNSDRTGGDVVVLTGTAAREDTMPPQVWDAYLRKYADQITELGLTPESFASSYAVPIRVRVERLRSW